MGTVDYRLRDSLYAERLIRDFEATVEREEAWQREHLAWVARYGLPPAPE